MNKTTRLALAALVGFGLSASGAITDTTWWNVDFESPTPVGTDDEGNQAGGVTLVEGELGALTNTYNEATEPITVAPYASGYWAVTNSTGGDISDESYITNGIVTNVVAGVSVETNSVYLALNTQGDDLRWTPTNTVANKMTLVDADILLVGSDSAPDAADFDAGGDVQTAIYLKNFIDEENGGEVTNSLLCVYVYAGSGGSYWQELDGTPLSDNSWHHVRVLVDYTPAADGDYATVQVFVDDMVTPMHARDDASTTSWTVANRGNDYNQLSSVSFRGTGAIDNFVGKTREEFFPTLAFAAEVYIDGVKQAYDELDEGGNLSRLVSAEAGDPGSGKKVTFLGFRCDDYDESIGEPPSYSFRSVEIFDFVGGTNMVFSYEYDETTGLVSPVTEGIVTIDTEQGDQTGTFSLNPLTDGAVDSTNLIAKIYFKTIGAYDALDVVDMAGAVTTNGFLVKPADIPMTTNWTFNAVEGGNILSNIVCYGGAAFASFENGVATVTNAFTAALAADTVFVKATYVPGTLAEGQELRATVDGDTVVFAPVTPPAPAVAIIVAGNVTNEYPSLLGAITNATAGDTIYLVADDNVSFSAENTEIGISKALTIDGNGHTLYGVTDYAYDGVNDHDIYISGSGAVTIKNLVLSEFSDTAPTVQQRTNPIWVGQGYTGKLVLDGVTVTNFNRTAINLGGGTFEITNCVIAGCYDPEMAGDRFQSAIEVFNANGTVAETTVTGIGSTIAREGSDIASCFTLQSNWATTPWTGGTGEITVLSGSYTGEFIGLGMTNAAGKLFIEGGTFVATAPKTVEVGGVQTPVSAFGLNGEGHASKIEISGGRFDREPEAEFIAAGYEASEDAPGTATPWTVVPAAYDIEFWADGTKVFETNGVAYLETGYGPATDPTKSGFSFDGWTNAAVDAAIVATADLPAATGDAVWTAVFTASASVEPVDPGASMTPAEKLAKPPVAVVTDPDSGDVSFTVHFKGEEGVTYSLVASTDCSITEEQWLGEATGADASGNAVTVDTATTADADENGIITLEAPMTDSDPDVMFFKIKASR